MKTTTESEKNWQDWELHRAVTPKNTFIIFILFIALGFSAHNTQIDKAAVETSKALLSAIGIGESDVLDGAIRFKKKHFPFKFLNEQLLIG